MVVATPEVTDATTRPRLWPTVLVWLLHLACVATAASFATVFVLMATSLDPMEMVNAGSEPWTNAFMWTLVVLAVVLVSAVGLVCWHSRRLRSIGVALLAVEIGGIIWAGLSIYQDYF